MRTGWGRPFCEAMAMELPGTVACQLIVSMMEAMQFTVDGTECLAGAQYSPPIGVDRLNS